ncbi:MAG: hypothetical protein HAW61_04265, partial [Candidatus Portiera sp.]|nr:hypothetical protein [Portiera sp.]
GSNLDIRQTRSFIPWLALQENTAQWLNKSLVGGMTNELALSVRGDVKYFGSDQSIFELGISLADGTLVYREDKEPIKAPKFDIFMTQDDLKVLLPDGGNIGDIAVLESGYGLVDIATADFALGGTGKINLATAPDLLYDYIINDDDSEPVNWQARGVAFGDWEFQYNLRSQEFLNADLNLQTMQSEVSLTNSPTYKIANITGSVGVSELGYTGNLTGYYQGEEIVGTFSDNPKGNVLQVSGLLTIPKITYPYVSGKGRFNLEAYTEGKGSLLLSDYLVTSDMRGIALNLPYPLQKRAKASMPLTIAKSDRAKHSVKYVSLGRELFLGWRDEDDDVVGVELRVPGKRVSSPNRLTIAKGGVIELLPANRLNFDIWYEFLSSLGLTGGDFAKSSNKKSGNSDDFYRSIYEGINQYIEKFPYADINVGKFEWKGSKYDYVNFDYNSQESSWVDFSFQQPQEYQASGKFMLDKSAYKVTADIYGVSILEDVDDKASGDKGSKEKSKQQSEEIIKRLVDYVPGIITPPKNFSKFPAVDLTVQSIYYEGDFIGSISANIATTPSRISLNIKDSNIIGLATRGEFIWERTSSAASKLSLVLDLDGDMDSSYIKNIAARDVDLHFDWAWQGDNKDFHKWYDSASSSLSISSNRGTLVSDRANVLINVVGFLNINSYVRAVTGDFSSWSNSNNTVTYRGANINMDLEKGKYVLQEESKIIFPFVKIDASGHYVIADDKLDANVIATSPTTSILPITALILGASALAPLLISIDIAGGDFFNRFSSAVYKVNGTLADPQSSLVRISDISGKKLDPNDLANQVDIKSRLDSLRF